MKEYSPLNLFLLRRWYGKWAMIYSTIYLSFAVLQFVSQNYAFSAAIMVTMTAVATLSYAHLWPACRATHIVTGDRRALKYGFWVGVLIWPVILGMIFLIDQKTAFLGSSITFLFFAGPPLLMFEVYTVRLEKGNPIDQDK